MNSNQRIAVLKKKVGGATPDSVLMDIQAMIEGRGGTDTLGRGAVISGHIRVLKFAVSIINGELSVYAQLGYPNVSKKYHIYMNDDAQFSIISSADFRAAYTADTSEMINFFASCLVPLNKIQPLSKGKAKKAGVLLSLLGLSLGDSIDSALSAISEALEVLHAEVELENVKRAEIEAACKRVRVGAVQTAEDSKPKQSNPKQSKPKQVQASA